MANATEENEGKRKFALYIRESTLEQVRKWYPLDDCTSQSEFIEKAVKFYIGFISSDNGSDYLPKIIISTLKGIVNESDNRISRILFKMAVEQAITMNVVVIMHTLVMAMYMIPVLTLSKLPMVLAL